MDPHPMDLNGLPQMDSAVMDPLTLNGLIARTPEDYIAKVIRLGTDPAYYDHVARKVAEGYAGNLPTN